ncbi:hypothetical protein LRS03_10780 [Rhizobacter sp. J219]|uniref:hypothetical protein n=1 Tax=Rhizobacter sp. J219 TaxID=2898430 RepID=UPI002151C47F|nr:hypothetical protein [Rhizobacter sp. J219]MCR5883311.1 hypothetical protein [Rhizobacter sp. J219]
MSQIVVDAVIGMIPLVGDVTAVRDIIAVSIRLVDDPKAREDKMEWVLLVVLIIALIPVAGGVVKGVGRLTIKAVGDVAHLAGAARAAKLAESARDIVAFLNKIGIGNAERFLLKLRFADHQAAVLAKMDELVYVINGALVAIKKKLGGLLSEGLRQRIDGLITGLSQLKAKAHEMIPQAVKELDQTLREIQQAIRSGGETTSRTTAHTVVAGDKAAISMTDELRLIEGQTALRSRRGGWEKNPGFVDQFEAKGLYKHEPGYPNLLDGYTETVGIGTKKKTRYVDVTTYAGRIVNRPLDKGEQLFRVFGPEGATHGAEVVATKPGGNPKYPSAFWGVGQAPETAEQWRKVQGAVLDEWNRDGFIVIGTVQESGKVKAVTGKIAEQTGKDIPGQYLPGGGKQAKIAFDKNMIDQLNAAGERVMATGKAEKLTSHNVSFEIKPTGWKDANGIHGYSLIPGPATVQTARLTAREYATKDQREAAHGGAR